MAVLVVFLVLSSGCSDDDGGDASAPEETATTTGVGAGTAATDPAGADDDRCEPAAGIGPGTEVLEVASGGVTRSVQRVLPAQISDGARLPLVIDLHGFSSGIDEQSLFSAMPERAGARGFVVLTPQGVTATVPIGGAVLEAAYWNAQSTEPDGAVDDVAFLTDLIETAVTDLCVDPARVHLTGNSMGAAMATTMACARPDLIASIAPIAGVNLAAECDDPGPVPVLAFHGDADPFVPFECGATARQPSDLVPVPDRMADLATAAGCDPTAVTTRVRDDIDHTVWSGCEPGVDVQLYRVIGGGRTWPGMLDYVDMGRLAEIGQDQALVSAAGLDLAQVAGNMTTSISATDLALDFFEAHPRTG